MNATEQFLAWSRQRDAEIVRGLRQLDREIAVLEATLLLAARPAPQAAEPEISRAPGRRIKDLVLARLNGHAVPVSRLLQITGYSRHSVQSEIQKMQLRGEIVRVRHGVYRRFVQPDRNFQTVRLTSEPGKRP